MAALQKIAEIEAEMARTQKNKATNGHLGLLKAKLAKLRASIVSEGTKAGGGGGGNAAFEVSKTGDARVGFVGFPSVGKSTLLNKMTGVESEVASYEFTTLTCIPGIFYHKGAKIQLLDLPGIIEGAKDGKGRGKQVISTAYSCSLILIVLDVMKPIIQKRKLEYELEGFGIRLNKKPPNILFKKKEKGGIALSIAPGYELKDCDEEGITGVLKEYRYLNCQLRINCNATIDEIIDVIEGNRKYCPCIYVMNKIDQITIEELDIIADVPDHCPICAHHEWNLDGLADMIWGYMQLLRIYTKPKGQIPDYTQPVILPADKNKIEDFCLRIHKTLLAQFRVALVWGQSVKHNPMRCGKEHMLMDEDVVQIIKKI
jgi:small GTP-binding protein